jgi:Na+-translocating ferredoxin:NAD+ oxidoreductase RnfG subunit
MKHIKTIVVLTIVVVSSMMSVFFVEGITSPIVQARINETINAALVEFFPEADIQPSYEVSSEFETNDLIRNVYRLQQDGEDIGIFYRARFSGWIGPIEILIGIDVRTNEVVNVNVLEQGETAGIGDALLNSPLFLASYNRVDAMTLQEDGVDMPAGTSAPLTLGRFNQGVKNILIFHAVNYLGEEAPVIETPQDIQMRLLNQWFPNETFTDVAHSFDAIEELKVSSSGGYYFIVRFKGSGGESGEGITRYLVGFQGENILGLEALEVGETPEYGGVYLSKRDTIAQFNNRNLEEFITTGLDSYTGATVTRSAFDQSINMIMAYYQTEILGLEEATKRAIDEEIYDALTSMADAAEFRNESIKQGTIYGVFTSRDEAGAILGVFYHIVHDNGDWSEVNHSIVELDPQTNNIRQLNIVRNNSSYTTHWPAGVGLILTEVDMSFLQAINRPGMIERADFDLQAGASTNPAQHTIPALINALNEVLTYQTTHQIGGN